MKIEKHAYRKSIPNAFYMDQMKVLSAAKKCTFFYNICVTKQLYPCAKTCIMIKQYTMD